MRSAAFAMRALRLGAASLAVVAGFSVVGVASHVGPATGGCVQASSAHHATLVVEHANGVVTKACVSFAGGSVSGAQLLDLSGVPYDTVDYGSYGKAVCKIEGEPASYPPSCWTASSPYWALFVSRGGGAWTPSSRGISTQTFGDGDAEGFRYENQSDNSVPASPAGVCPPPVQATPPPATSAPAASAHPGPIRSAGSQSTSAVPGGARAGAATPSVAATSPAAASPGVSSPPPVAAQTRAGPSPPTSSGSANAGVWVASALGAALLVLLVVQLTRTRRTRTRS